ncbi:transposase [Aeromonas veronii]|uniref:transposase n=1 Tax=Aeromonas TaxID=642 RepID=UPI0038D4D16E
MVHSPSGLIPRSCTTDFTKTITGYGAATSYTATRASAPLMLKRNFNLTLLATQEILYSLFALMNVPLCLSDYRGASKRISTVTVAYRQPFKAKVTDQVSTQPG